MQMQQGRHAVTDLHRACFLGRKRTVFRLLGQGADPNQPDDDGCLPLEAAVLGRCERLARAEQRGRKAPGDPHRAVVQLLLRGGADVSAVGKTGATALHHAAGRDGRLLRLLLKSGARVDAVDRKGATPLHYAANDDDPGSLARARILLQAGAHPDHPSARGETTLEANAAWGNWRMVQLLVAAGASPDVQDPEGRTPLCWATDLGGARAVDALLRSGASVDPSGVGWSPLMRAADFGSPRMVRLLLAAGADINASVDGHTAFSLAARYAGKDLIEVLRQVLRWSEYFGSDPVITTARSKGDFGESRVEVHVAPTQGHGVSVIRCPRHHEVLNLLRRWR
jgi:ankyrin repeat protein